MSEWISVKDRLPDNKDRYLCACFDYVTNTYWIDILWYVSGRWWGSLITMGTDKDYNDHVRYWMPLPEPPLEADDGQE